MEELPLINTALFWLRFMDLATLKSLTPPSTSKCYRLSIRRRGLSRPLEGHMQKPDIGTISHERITAFSLANDATSPLPLNYSTMWAQTQYVHGASPTAGRVTWNLEHHLLNIGTWLKPASSLLRTRDNDCSKEWAQTQGFEQDARRGECLVTHLLRWNMSGPHQQLRPAYKVLQRM